MAFFFAPRRRFSSSQRSLISCAGETLRERRRRWGELLGGGTLVGGAGGTTSYVLVRPSSTLCACLPLSPFWPPVSYVLAVVQSTLPCETGERGVIGESRSLQHMRTSRACSLPSNVYAPVSMDKVVSAGSCRHPAMRAITASEHTLVNASCCRRRPLVCVL